LQQSSQQEPPLQQAPPAQQFFPAAKAGVIATASAASIKRLITIRFIKVLLISFVFKLCPRMSRPGGSDQENAIAQIKSGPVRQKRWQGYQQFMMLKNNGSEGLR
jgi:hypothetical protein